MHLLYCYVVQLMVWNVVFRSRSKSILPFRDLTSKLVIVLLIVDKCKAIKSIYLIDKSLERKD